MKHLISLLDNPARARFTLALFLSAFAGIAGVALLGLSGWFLTASALAGLAGAGFAFNYLYPSAGVRGFAFGRVLGRYTEQLVGHDATLRFSEKLRPEIFSAQARTLRGSAPMSSAALSALIDDVETVEGGFLRVLSPAAAVAASVAVAIGFVVAADPLIGVLTALAAGFAGWAAPAWASRRARKAARDIADETDRQRASVSQLVENAIELEIYGALPRLSTQAAQGLANHRNALDALEQPFRRLGAVNAALGGGLACLLLWRAGGEPDGWALAAGGALAMLAAFDALGAMAKVLDAAPRARAASDRIVGMLTAPKAVPEPSPETAMQLNAIFPIKVKELLFRAAPEASFIGPLSFVVPPCSVTFLTGSSGCGKTTLIETLMRLHPVERGMLTYNGVDSLDCRTPAVLAHVAFSPQFEAFIPGAVRNQFLMANPDANDERIWEALKIACLDDVIANRPEKLDAPLTETASGFSGGEMRRLNIARALVGDVSALALDEPFAGLEPALAQQIAANLTAWAREKERALIIAQHDAIAFEWSPLKRQTINVEFSNSN